MIVTRASRDKDLIVEMNGDHVRKHFIDRNPRASKTVNRKKIFVVREQARINTIVGPRLLVLARPLSSI
jgi:hypothetical protein